jgi:hypothetical protein
MFTEEEKARIRHHTGYLNVESAQTFVLGSPAAVQTQFLIEGAMQRVLPSGEVQVRRLLGILDGIEGMMVENLELLSVTQVDEIAINPEQMKLYRVEYDRWVAALCNIFGIPRNPFDQRGASSINVRVR